jgi:hypothetical protein
MQARVGLSELARLLRVHMQAVGAAVDLRRPCLHQRDQLGIEPAFLNVILDGREGGDAVGRDFERVQSLGHSVLSM